MSSNFLLFIFVVNFYDSHQIIEDLSPIPKISLIPSAENFVENKTTSFACHIVNAPADAKVVWSIRHKISRVKTFYTYNISRETAALSLKGGKSIFRLVMRRDFSDMEIVCRSAACHEGTFLLPKITETIPIERVIFPYEYSHQVRGERLLLRCDVKAKPGIVKKMFFRVPKGLARTKAISHPKRNWIRYAPFHETQTAKTAVHNNIPIQCLAVTKKLLSNYDNVMSPIKMITVHYLEFLQTSMRKAKTITLGESELLILRITANPRPSPNQFFVGKVDRTSGESKKIVPQMRRVTVLDIGLYSVHLRFIPLRSGMYTVFFESPEEINGNPIFRNSTPEFELKIFAPVFRKTKSHWHNNSVPRNRLITLTFFLSAVHEPTKEQLQLYVRKTDQNDDTDFVPVGLTQIKREDEKYFRIEMTLYCIESGFYTPVLRSGNLSILGPDVKIIVIEDRNVLHLGLIQMGLVLLIFLIVGVLCLHQCCELGKKLDASYGNVQIRIVAESIPFIPHRVSDKTSIEVILSRILPDVKKQNISVMVDGHIVDPSRHRPSDLQIITVCGPERLFLRIMDPKSWRSVKDLQLQLEPLELRWRSATDRVKPFLSEFPISENCIVSMFGRYYANNRLALTVWEVDGEMVYRDEENGREVALSDSHRYFWSFLAPSSPFRWPSDCCPLIEMRTNSFFVRLDTEGTFVMIEEAEAFDQKWVAFIQLLAFEYRGRSRHFVRLTEGHFCQCNTDDIDNEDASKSILANNDAVVYRYDSAEKTWSRRFLLLEDNTLLPNWRISPLAEIIVFYRVGVTLGIEDGILKVKNGSGNPQFSEWTAPTERGDAFQIEFSNCLRKWQTT